MPLYLCNIKTGEVISRKEERSDDVKVPLGNIRPGFCRVASDQDIPVSDLPCFRLQDGFIVRRPQAEITQIKEAERSFAVRAKRRPLLEGSDWTQADDVPRKKKAAWSKYRQKLRDVTDQPGFPNKINWPKQPGEEDVE